MTFLEGKSPAEKKKIAAAAILMVLALASLFYAFGPRIGGSSTTTVKVTTSPTPRPAGSQRANLEPVAMPSRQEEELSYMIPVAYTPGAFGAPDPGRNIFAFYEPPPPCPDCPTPLPPTPAPVIPTPTPQMPFELYGVSPQSVYAGSKTFRIEASGDRFTPDAKIFFNGIELATTFVGPQRLAATVPANAVGISGNGQILVRTPDGKGYSLPTFLSIQPPPKPQVKYIGMIARKLGNNDTAYFEEPGKQTPIGYRLNDVVGGRFRVIDISSERVMLEDVQLGFKHPIELFRPAPGTVTTGTGTAPGGRTGFPGGFPQRPIQNPTQNIPGIPNNIPRYTPPRRPGDPNSNTNPPKEEDDEDDDEPKGDG